MMSGERLFCAGCFGVTRPNMQPWAWWCTWSWLDSIVVATWMMPYWHCLC